jgi:prepilin-type processing-associated H-X9-DG protein
MPREYASQRLRGGDRGSIPDWERAALITYKSPVKEPLQAEKDRFLGLLLSLLISVKISGLSAPLPSASLLLLSSNERNQKRAFVSSCCDTPFDKKILTLWPTILSLLPCQNRLIVDLFNLGFCDGHVEKTKAFQVFLVAAMLNNCPLSILH